MIELINGDCMDYMRGLPDKCFDLAIVDPPYGIGGAIARAGNGKNSQSKFSKSVRVKNWDKLPSEEYFLELYRVSKNQIIWGGNYFNLSPTRCFICWDKMVYIPTMSRIEQAWTSFDRLPKLIQINNNDANRVHPTQKPIQLYKWLLINYAEKGQRILDTHLGSGSSAIAADILGFDFVGIELDKDYFEAAKLRLDNHQRQLKLF